MENITKNKKMILKEIEKKAKNLSLPILGPKKGRLLEKIIKHYKPKNVLEIGTLVGYSAILMSQHMPEESKITTIEINPEAAEAAKKNFIKAGIKKSIRLLVGDAMKKIPKLKGPFDLLFLDGAKDEYYNYILLAENKLAPNAVVVADNVKMFENDMKDYLDYVRVNENYESEKYEINDDAMEVSFKV